MFQSHIITNVQFTPIVITISIFQEDCLEIRFNFDTSPNEQRMNTKRVGCKINI